MGLAKFPLSVVVIAKNEAKSLGRCLQALDWCDDVIVVDDESTDETALIATRRGARVVSHRFESFAAQRNWALANADLKHPWALMLDADEVVTRELKSEIERTLPRASGDLSGFRMCRKTMFLGKWLKYSDGFPVWIVRMVRVGRFQFEDSGHGEVAVPVNSGSLGTLFVPFVHYPFDKGLAHWLDRHNQYSTREATLELRDLEGIRWRDLLSGDRAQRRRAWRGFSRRLPCRSLLRFFYQYVIKRGFLDGYAGLAFSWLMATYEGLIVLKRRELNQTQRNVDLRSAIHQSAEPGAEAQSGYCGCHD